MSYYPIMLDVSDKRCVVVGGGQVARRKAEALLQRGARVEVISPQLCPELEAMAASGAVEAIRRDYTPGDVEGALLAIAATDSDETNRRVAEEAASLGALINVVDNPGLSNFIVPSCLQRGDVTIAVSTDGKSPALARRIRLELEKIIGDEHAELASLADEVRSELKARGISVNGEGWQRALELKTLLKMLRAGDREGARERLSRALKEHAEASRRDE